MDIYLISAGGSLLFGSRRATVAYRTDKKTASWGKIGGTLLFFFWSLGKSCRRLKDYSNTVRTIYHNYREVLDENDASEASSFLVSTSNIDSFLD